MKCKELKISIKQYGKISSIAYCKFTMQIDGKKYTSQLDLTVFNHKIHNNEINDLINELHLHLEVKLILIKARIQMHDDKEFGIDTYWKWSENS